jgi:hypothetical protein
MQNVSEFEKSSIRKNWQQDSANDLSRGSLKIKHLITGICKSLTLSMQKFLVE